MTPCVSLGGHCWVAPWPEPPLSDSPRAERPRPDDRPGCGPVLVGKATPRLVAQSERAGRERPASADHHHRRGDDGEPLPTTASSGCCRVGMVSRWTRTVVPPTPTPGRRASALPPPACRRSVPSPCPRRANSPPTPTTRGRRDRRRMPKGEWTASSRARADRCPWATTTPRSCPSSTRWRGLSGVRPVLLLGRWRRPIRIVATSWPAPPRADRPTPSTTTGLRTARSSRVSTPTTSRGRTTTRRAVRPDLDLSGRRTGHRVHTWSASANSSTTPRRGHFPPTAWSIRISPPPPRRTPRTSSSETSSCPRWSTR